MQNEHNEKLVAQARTEYKGPPSVAASEFGGVRLRITKDTQHFANMQAG